MENSGTFKNIIIVILIAVASYFSYSAYNAEDQLNAQIVEIKNLNGQISTLNQKVTDYEKADAQKKAIVADLEAKVAAQSKDLEDLKAQLVKSVKPAVKAKEAPKAKKTK
jgi:cell division protein FtsB